jgi:aryl-alcohol dehydrogenase-like predicted oxidoreductase
VLTDAEIRRKHSITAQYIAVSLQQSIRNTELESIDVYLLHNPEVSLEFLGETSFYNNLIKTFAMLEQRVRDGVIGTYGISTRDGLRTLAAHKRHIDLQRVMSCAEMAAGGSSNLKVIELPLNYVAREAATVLSQELDCQLVSSLDLAAARGLLVLTSSSVMSGVGETGKSLQFVLSYPQVTCALVGMRRLEHVDQAVAIMGLERSEPRSGGARESKTAAVYR